MLKKIYDLKEAKSRIKKNNIITYLNLNTNNYL